MTKRSYLKGYVHSLKEISDIMAAMKNLSLIEINKISKFLTTQTRVVKTIEDIGADFLYFFPQTLDMTAVIQPKIYILIGSERGFCANFNENIVNQWQIAIQNQPREDVKCILVGRKLAMKLQGNKQVITSIDGPNVTEEIPTVIVSLIQSLEALSSKNLQIQHPGNWNIIYTEINENQIQTKMLSPFAKLHESKTIPFAFKPILNLRQDKFFSQFLDQYLFAELNYLFYQSLMAENHQRLHHMDGAISKLEKKRTKITHQLNILRQEEITEEIEIILLSAEEILQEIIR